MEGCVEDEVLEWYRMSPQARWAESMRLWDTFFLLGGQLEPESDSRSPSTMREHGVEALLMGGQACVLYGAAEFSRDADFAILASPENLGRLQGALDRAYWEPLKAELEALRHRRGRSR
jgi:hypothetical protein